MAQALAMEREAVERYTEFADALEMHNNHEVAALFRTMAGYEAKHAEQIMAEMGWTERAAGAAAARSTGPAWRSPETTPFDEVHYLMQPWHALQLALAAEKRAAGLLRRAGAAWPTSEPVRARRARTAGRGGRARRAGAGLDRQGAAARPGLGQRPRPAALHRLDAVSTTTRSAMRALLPEGWAPPIGYANGIEVDAGPHRVHRRPGGLGRAAAVRTRKTSRRSSSRRWPTCSRCWPQAGGEPQHICRITAFCCDKPAYLAARPRARCDLAAADGPALPGDEHDLRGRPARPPRARSSSRPPRCCRRRRA